MGTHTFKHLFMAFLVVCSLTANVSAEDKGKGSIVWTEGYVTGIGYGTSKATGNKAKDRLHALRVAEVTAQRALLETIKGVRIDSMTTVENQALVEDKIRTRVEGIVKGAQIIRKDLEWVEGAPLATVEMRICLTGGITGCKGPSLASALSLDTIKTPPHLPTVPMVIEKPLPVPAPLPVATQQPVRKKSVPTFDPNRKVTGVVFNLEGRFFEREMLPIIVTRSESQLVTVYCVKNVKPAIVRSFGAVRYTESLEHASKISNLGDNLLIMPVADVSKENMIIITTEDANILRQTMMNGNDYLNDAKVAISAQ